MRQANRQQLQGQEGAWALESRMVTCCIQHARAACELQGLAWSGRRSEHAACLAAAPVSPLYPPPPSSQSLLPSLPRLAHLGLFKAWDFGDEHLSKAVVHAQGLRSLDLRGTWVTARGLGELSQLATLERLALAPHAELGADGAAALAGLSQLRGLALGCSVYSPPVVEAVARMTWLQVGGGSGLNDHGGRVASSAAGCGAPEERTRSVRRCSLLRLQSRRAPAW
jgi:hypothetical protein